MSIMDVGLDKKDRKVVSDGLIRILADTTILYLKTRNYHWNVVGPLFSQLHKLFEDIYGDLEAGADDIAERIRALGFYAPASFAEYVSVSAIKEETGSPEALDMVRELTLDHELLIRRSVEIMDIADSVRDVGTSDLLVERIRLLSKHAWMLRSHLE
ncbi:Dps family protein [Candidatus Paracaedibacter symbiosus]|uniref:Dps family protein n=1 Tax=Candidatus Paracaedibacter symbiosus TaxID=244582 RepID=UPI0005099261|nr:Dps family protein [Candidatus Paracaedibacter symbiosus]